MSSMKIVPMMKFSRVYVHSLVLAVINIAAILFGSRSHPLAAAINPVAMQIPLSSLLSIGLFVIWSAFFEHQRLQLFGITKPSDFFKILGVSLLWGPAIFIPLHYGIQKHLLSPGTLVSLWIFQIIVNSGALFILYAFQQHPLVTLKTRFFRSSFFLKILAICIGIFFCFLLLGILEGGFYLINTTQKTDENRRHDGQYIVKYFQNGGLQGYGPIPDNVATSILINGEHVVYDVTYSIDKYGRRITPISTDKNSVSGNVASQFALFFGCSFTFGEGVEDNETLPFYFTAMEPSYHPYNYGFHGYGPQNMLVKLESGTLRDEIEQKRGILLYTYLEEAHEARAIGTMEVYNGWGSNMPYYTKDPDGNLYRKGTFTTGRPFISLLYTILGKSQVLKFFHFNLPLSLREKHYAFTAYILKRSRDLFEQQFPNSRFYVVFYPKFQAKKTILPYLKEAGISYFDYAELFDPSRPEYHIEGDGHPSPQAYRIVASHIVQDLEIRK